MQHLVHSIVIGFLFQNPAQYQISLKLGKGLEFFRFTIAYLTLPLSLVYPDALCPLTSFLDHTLLLFQDRI